MKICITPILTALVLTQLLIAGCKKHQEMESGIQKEPEDSLIRDVKIGGFPNEPNPGRDALVSKGPRVMPDLARIMLQSKSRDEQIKAVDAMGTIANHNPLATEVQDSVPALMTAAQNSDSEVQFRAVQALGAIGKGASNAIPVLIQLTKDQNASVRMCAVEALGRMGATSRESVAALNIALTDTSDDVRITAKQALELIQQFNK